uniref:Uncharacterized protein n=1 Tax=Anopheles atroparvus TaxID=41427 RepID=A0AAG5CRF2_ANOAO
MTIDLLRLPVLLQQATQHSHAVHPQQLLRHTRVGRTLPLAIAAVATLTAGDGVFAHTVPRVHDHRFLDDQTILDQLLTGVGVSNLVDFIRIQPDLLLAASHNRGCQPLLKLEGTENKFTSQPLLPGTSSVPLPLLQQSMQIRIFRCHVSPHCRIFSDEEPFSMHCTGLTA